MKKTLAAVAVLGAFAGSALAADVQLYGIIDTGFQYKHFDSDLTGFDSTDSFSMETGQQSGSRFGFKGTEDLGNGLTVGFILENQFDSDTGALKDGLLFRRESSLFLQGGFGKIAFGRMGSINQGVSSWGKIGRISAFGTSWTNSAQVGTIMSTSTIYDNMISYETPDFAGFKVYAQYGMGDNGAENESGSNRYYALGATYDNGPVSAYLAVDSINYKSWQGTYATDPDDSLTVTFGGSYNFEVAKVYLGVQYFDEVSAKYFNGTEYDPDNNKYGINEMVKGWAVLLSADAPIAGGKAMFGAGYYDAEAADSADTDFDLSRWVVSAGYDYPLSKRTNVYGVATYAQDSYERKGMDDVEPNVFAVMIGLRHKF